jgi:hypothetical protein
MLALLRGEIYELRSSNGLRCHDTHAKFNKDWFSHSKVRGIDLQTYTEIRRRTDTHIHRQQGDFISLLLFFQNKKIMQKTKCVQRCGSNILK